MDGLPGAKALRQVPPRNPRPITINYGFYKDPIVLGGHADTALPPRKQTLDPLPLLISQSVAAHQPTLLVNGWLLINHLSSNRELF
jgi:hypothetical protein